jgi:hypothetical protein
LNFPTQSAWTLLPRWLGRRVNAPVVRAPPEPDGHAQPRSRQTAEADENRYHRFGETDCRNSGDLRLMVLTTAGLQDMTR